MRAVWKYRLPQGTGLCRIPVPCESELLHVAEQDGVICCWASVDPDNPIALYAGLRLVTTGHAYDPRIERHVSTLLLDGGRFVLHAFQVELGPILAIDDVDIDDLPVATR